MNPPPEAMPNDLNDRPSAKISRRRYPRFDMIAWAEAFLPKTQHNLEVKSVHDVARGGAGLYCKERVPPGAQVCLSLYTKGADCLIAAESIPGTVVSVVRLSAPLVLVNICFSEPISSSYQPDLYRRLTELEASS